MKNPAEDAPVVIPFAPSAESALWALLLDGEEQEETQKALCERDDEGGQVGRLIYRGLSASSQLPGEGALRQSLKQHSPGSFSWLTAWLNSVKTEEFERSYAEASERYKSAQVENHEALVEAFAGHGIDYDREIFPLFDTVWQEFTWLWLTRQATETAIRKYQTWLKRYEVPVRLLTEPASPFPQSVKEHVRAAYAQLVLRPAQMKELLLRLSQRLSVEARGMKVLDRNLQKAPSKQPAWMELQVHLSALLIQRGVSETQTWHLIGKLFSLLIPHWFDVGHPEDAIRLNVKKHHTA